jgi:hypothetical protein
MVAQKLGIAYNVFDGEELLPYSLQCVRDTAQYIVVVYQTISNFGNKNKNLLPLLKQLQEQKLIDELVEYTPILSMVDKNGNSLNKGGINEQRKRNIGLEKCVKNQCTIFSSMDTDEMYLFKDYYKALKDFIDGGYDSSFCQMQTYYKRPDMIVSPPEDYFVPLFYKISGKRNKLRFEFIQDYQIICDGTRMIKAGFPKIFTRDEIVMHHFSYVRNSLDSKVENSSAQMGNREKEMVVNHFNNWNYGDKAIFLGNQIFDLVESVNHFEIKFNDYSHKIDLPIFVNKTK